MKTGSKEALTGEVLAPGEESSQEQFTQIELSDLRPETQDYAIRIGDNWRLVAASIIETGRAITDARAALKKEPVELERLEEYLKNRLGISSSERSKLELIGANKVFELKGITDKLPTAVATLYKLTQLPDARLKEALATDEISPATTLTEVNKSFFAPKAKKKKPTLTVSISGAPKNIPIDKLTALASLLDEFEAFIVVKRSGF